MIELRTCKKCGNEKPLELFVKNGQRRKHTCKACDAKRVLEYQKANKESVNAKNRAWVNRNPEAKKANAERSIAHARANPEMAKARKDRYRSSAQGSAKEQKYNLAYKAKHKERINANKLEWMKLNKHRVNAATNNRRAAKLCAIPNWYDSFFVEEAYHLAKLRSEMLGSEWHVDHLVPLISKDVCGLHVIDNLQVIPASMNRSKNNRYWPDMPVVGG